MKNEFKDILRKKREERGESQGALATAVGCSLKTVYRWELGERFPDGISLSRLADHFGCTTDELLGRPPLNPTLPVRQEKHPCLTGQTAP